MSNEVPKSISSLGGLSEHALLRATARTADGRTIAYAETVGEGPDLLLIHGTLTTLEDMWLGLMPALAPHFHIVAVDRPGHGESVRTRLVDASPWRQAEIIHEAMKVMGLRRPTIVGHSAGGAVALALGMLFPEDVTGVVALAPICFPEPRLEQMIFGPRAVPFMGELLTPGGKMPIDPLLLPFCGERCSCHNAWRRASRQISHLLWPAGPNDG